MTKPKLLCLLQLPPPVHGASVMNEHVVTSPLVREAFELDVIPLQFARSVDDISTIRVAKLVRAAAIAVDVGRALATRRPAAMYFTLSPAGGAFYRDCAYIALAKLARVPRVYHLHGKGIQKELGSRWKRAVYRWAFRDASVVHLSPLLERDLQGLVSHDRIRFVPNGIAAVQRAAVAPRDGGRFRLLYLSSMAEEKGPLVLFDAIELALRRGVDLDVTFAGPRFGDTTEVLEQRIRDSGRTDRIRYVGPVFGDAKRELFAAHDAFVFPTYYGREAFPLVVLEAMQSGLPVVSTQEGAIAEMVVDGQTGYLVPPRDVASLADRIERLAGSRTEAREMGQRGRRRFEQHFTLEQFEGALVRALQDLVTRAP